MKKSLILLFLLCAGNFIVSAQNGVNITPSVIDINIDTFGTGHCWGYYKLKLKVKVENNSKNSIQLDSNLSMHYSLIPKTIKPGESGWIYIGLNNIIKQVSSDSLKVINIGFYKLKSRLEENRIIKKIAVNITFDKSKRVFVEQPSRNVDILVKSLFESKRKQDSSIHYDNFNKVFLKLELKIENLTQDTLFIPKFGQAWNDTGPIISYNWFCHSNCFKALPPKKTKATQVRLGMGHKKKFNLFGNLIIHSSDYATIDIINTQFISGFDGN